MNIKSIGKRLREWLLLSIRWARPVRNRFGTYVGKRFAWALIPLALLFTLWFLPEWEVRLRLGVEAREQRYPELVNQYRTTWAQILGGFGLLFGLYLTWRRITATEEGQITERFTRAINQLGSEKLEIRLGGIYALERIAKDSRKDHWQVMEVLTAYVRENAPWKGKLAGGKPEVGRETSERSLATEYVEFELPQTPTDIQAVLTVLGRRKREHEKPPYRKLNLERTDLQGAHLIGADLEGINLSEANLEWAILHRIYLEGAWLHKTQLHHADLEEAHLEGARLWDANLKMADLIEAHLEEASLSGAHLEGAWLDGAHLEGANLTHATGLTREQIAKAYTDGSTKLPDYLQAADNNAEKKKDKPGESNQT